MFGFTDLLAASGSRSGATVCWEQDFLEEGRNPTGELRVNPHSSEQFAFGLISELLK